MACVVYRYYYTALPVFAQKLPTALTLGIFRADPASLPAAENRRPGLCSFRAMNPRLLRLALAQPRAMWSRHFSQSQDARLSAWALLKAMAPSAKRDGMSVLVANSGAGRTPLEEALPDVAKALNKSFNVIAENEITTKLPKDGSVALLIVSKHIHISRHVYRALCHGGTIAIYSDSSAASDAESNVTIEQSVAAAIFRDVRIVGFELGSWRALHPQQAREGADALSKI